MVELIYTPTNSVSMEYFCVINILKFHSEMFKLFRYDLLGVFYDVLGVHIYDLWFLSFIQLELIISY